MDNRTLPGKIGLLLFLVLAILPILFSLGYAAAYSLGLTGLLSDGFTWAHWRVVFSGREVWQSLGLSIYISAITVLLTVVVSMAIALYLRDRLAKGMLSSLMYLPLAIPGYEPLVVSDRWTPVSFVKRWTLSMR